MPGADLCTLPVAKPVYLMLGGVSVPVGHFGVVKGRLGGLNAPKLPPPYAEI